MDRLLEIIALVVGITSIAVGEAASPGPTTGDLGIVETILIMVGIMVLIVGGAIFLSWVEER